MKTPKFIYPTIEDTRNIENPSCIKGLKEARYISTDMLAGFIKNLIAEEKLHGGRGPQGQILASRKILQYMEGSK